MSKGFLRVCNMYIRLREKVMLINIKKESLHNIKVRNYEILYKIYKNEKISLLIVGL